MKQNFQFSHLSKAAREVLAVPATSAPSEPVCFFFFSNLLKSTARKGSHLVVSYPDPDSQQLRMDYITATWKVSTFHVAVMKSIRSCWESGSGYETTHLVVM